MSLAAVGALVERLLLAYAVDAWPFAFLHFVVMVYLGRSILRLVRESAELRAWDPAGPQAEGPAAVLSSFIRDSADLGGRGFVVPLTDYSDRLDSEVENLVNEVTDRTNMLLLVGIAGTLFGVFEFASRTIAVRDDRLAQIGLILAESMAKAFPVGFVGLMLMLVFQLAIAAPVSRLYRAASDATRRALEHRGIVSRTLAESIAASIGDAMRPVSTLGDTVSQHLQPVVATLGQQLNESLSLIKTQFVAIDQSTDRFIKATSNLHQSANALTNISSRLESMFRAVPSVLANTEKVQQLHHDTMQEVSAAFRRHVEEADVVAASLQRVRDSTEDLPAELVRRMSDTIRPAVHGLIDESANTWRAMLRVVGNELQREHADIVAQTRREIALVHAAVGSAASEWERLARDSEAMIARPLQAGLDGIAEASQRALSVTGHLAVSTQAAAEDLARLPEHFADRSAEFIRPAFERIAEESRETWRELVRGVAVDVQRDYAEFLTTSRRELETTHERLRAAADEMRRLAEEAQSSLTAPMEAAIEVARRETSVALAEVGEFVRERYPAIRQDMQAFGTEMSTILQALRMLEQRLRFLNVPVQQQGSGDSAETLKAILAELQAQTAKSARPETIWERLLRPLRSRA